MKCPDCGEKVEKLIKSTGTCISCYRRMQNAKHNHKDYVKLINLKGTKEYEKAMSRRNLVSDQVEETKTDLELIKEKAKEEVLKDVSHFKNQKDIKDLITNHYQLITAFDFLYTILNNDLDRNINLNKQIFDSLMLDYFHEVKPNGQFKVTEFNGPVKLPQNYSTDDEDEFNAIQILNQDKSSWKLQIDKDNMKVYSKLYKIIDEKGKEDDNIMFYTEATLNFSASEINKQLYTYSLREKWEKSLQKGKLIKDENLPNNLQITEYYAFIKMPLLFSDRDMVLRKKVWKDYQGEKDCTLSHLKSIEHPDFPAKKKPVRAEYENRGEYVKPINENQCKLYMATKFNMKVSAPVSMMEGKGSDSQAKWVKEFISHCGK
jgi:hypothetical protein